MRKPAVARPAALAIALLILTGLLPPGAPLAPGRALAQTAPDGSRWLDLTPAWTGPRREEARSAAWADVDGDGDLDLGTANTAFPAQLFRNCSRRQLRDGCAPGDLLSPEPVWSSNTNGGDVTSAAWVDVDNDGDPDFVQGNRWGGGTNIYRNCLVQLPGDGCDQAAGAPLLRSPAYQMPAQTVRSQSWGDVDRDGDLDLAVAVHHPNEALEAFRLFRNCAVRQPADGCADSQLLATSALWTSADPQGVAAFPEAVALADVNGDGWLDVAGGYIGGFLALFQSSAGSLPTAFTWRSTETVNVFELAWGDPDGDGDLDLASANQDRTRLYQNQGLNGGLAATAAWTSAAANDDARSLAWGDVDSDGRDDLAVGMYNDSGAPGRAHARIYWSSGQSWASGQVLTTSSVWSASSGRILADGLAFGDVDGDGDLDLALADWESPTRLYRNIRGPMPTASSASFALSNTRSSAWGDVDNDGDLDLALANENGGPDVVVYRTASGIPSADQPWSYDGMTNAMAVAWGDADNDGDLDLAVAAYGSAALVFRGCAISAPGDGCAGGLLSAAPVWSGPYRGRGSDGALSLAWGDVDGDGDLDLLVGGDIGVPARLYNGCRVTRAGDGCAPGALLSAAHSWQSRDGGQSFGVALGDIDGDSDLDLVVPNSAGQTALYRNEGGQLEQQPEREFTSSGYYGAIFGDIDGDGDLDLALSNNGQPIELYHNEGGVFGERPIWRSLEGNGTRGIALGDIDNDGDLDLTAASSGAAYLYFNEGGTLARAASWISDEIGQLLWVSLGDMDRDGDLDMAVANSNGPSRVYRSGRFRPGLAGIAPLRPGPAAGGTASAGLLSAGRIIGQQVVPISYALRDAQSRTVPLVRAEFSLDGGGSWLPAVDAAPETSRNRGSSPAGVSHTFSWQVPQSKVFGRSDHVVVRLIAAIPARQGLIAPLFQQGAFAAATTPFRLRGTQVRVTEGGQPVAGAVVYQRSVGGGASARVFAPGGGAPAFVTDAQGFLQGRGVLSQGETLYALRPVETTDVYSDSYDLYHTNLVPQLSDVGGYTVAGEGVQQIEVSAGRPLALFNLDISLEWDARYDERFLSQLRYDIRRASEFLFDATNGQAALGYVNVFVDKENWQVAHIRVYASNRYRPNAMLGGVAGALLEETVTVSGTQRTNVYGPGQVRMGAVWSRFGNQTGGSLSEDWSRTLAHELAHFLLFLDDNYVGLGAGGLQPVESCPGLMSDPYSSLELRPAQDWLPACAATLSQQTQGRSDWATVEQFYPALNAPAGNFGRPNGPTSLPLEVTEVQVVDPLKPTQRLAVPILATERSNARYLPSQRAAGYLIQDSWVDDDTQPDRMTSLGRPNLDQLLARGARVGDEVCLFDPAPSDGGAPLVGCRTLAGDSDRLALQRFADWRPEIVVTPVTSRSLTIELRNFDPAGAPLGLAGPVTARVFAFDDQPAAPPPTLDPVPGQPGVFRKTVALTDPLPEAYIMVDAGGGRRAISNYSMGGSPVPIRTGGAPIRTGGAPIRTGGAPIRTGGAPIRTGGAPTSSAEGDVLIFAEDVTFGPSQFFILQQASQLPPPPLWARQIGNGYRFTVSPDAPDLSGAELSFNYLGSEVPAGEEAGIKVYYRAPGATSWTRLEETSVNTYHNQAAVAYAGPGLYALMSSVELPLEGPGWNLLSYPVAGSRPVAEALAGIAGSYNAVYGWLPGGAGGGSWQRYLPGAPAYANNLAQLEYGRGYWIDAKSDITLPLRGSGAASLQATAEASPPTPPASYYGAVRGAANFSPAAGMAVVVSAGGVECGRGTTQLAGGQVVYVVDVASAAERAGCGAGGVSLRFSVGGRTLEAAVWSGAGGRRLDLGAGIGGPDALYLPLIVR